MRVTIIKDDGVVGVDGAFRHVDLSGLDPEIRAVQWNGDKGHIEYYDDESPNSVISDLAEFQGVIDLYNAPIDSPPDPAPSSPSIVTMRQARLALLQMGKLSQVNALIDAMPNAEAAHIEWEFSSTVQRDHALVAYIAASLPLTEAEVDDLFILADTL